MLLAVAAGAAESSPAEPLYEQIPFDRVTLDQANDNKQYDVEPLDLPGRIVPDPLPRSGKLVIRPRSEPGTSYQVQWYSVAKVELFEGLIVKEAEQLVWDGKLERAYDYFVFLERKYPKAPGLARAMEDFLIAEFRAAVAAKQYDRALAMMRELYERNEKRAKLDEALGAATNRLVEDYLAAKNYRAARSLLDNLAAWFPDHPIVAGHKGKLTQRAAALLEKAKADARTGNYAAAAENCRQVARIWPALTGARELALSLHEKHPRVTVGVVQLRPAATPDRMHDSVPRCRQSWATRRSGRLLCRTLTEFAGPGPDGGTYVCPVGEMSTQELGKRLVFQIDPGVRWSSADGVLTGYDVVRRLLAMADPADPSYRGCWAELIHKTSVRGVYRVDVQLHRSHVLPAALLQSPLAPPAGKGVRTLFPERPQGYSAQKSSDPFFGNGPYVLRSQSDAETAYLANTRYFAAGGAQPKEIVERRYARGTDAIRALRSNEIDVIDRVNPWDLKRLRDDDNLVVAPYGAPLLHCLIPNMRRTIPARRRFRRALVYGIDRQAILDRLTGGAALPGCKLASGPFLPGASKNDPLGYASDSSIALRAYEWRLARDLAKVSLQEAAVIRQKQGKTGEAASRLVLAHPATELARMACTSIQKRLEKLTGAPVELRELAAAPHRVPDDVDLLYAELAIWEPVVDARPLLGDDGITGECSPHLALALRQLERARNWSTVHECLHRIHRIAHDDVAVIPLWQLVDHFAYRKDIRGIGTSVLSLYQNVEQWQVNFYYPAD